MTFSRPEDTGTYRCIATNTAGLDEVSITLTVHGTRYFIVLYFLYQVN